MTFILIIFLASVPSFSFGAEELTLLDYKDPNSKKFKDPNLSPNDVCLQSQECFTFTDHYGISYGGKEGISNYPNMTTNEIRRTRDFIIFDAIYHTDYEGRRIAPAANEDAKKFAAFFGGSFTFGTGLNDNETLPSAFSRECPQYKPINYAVGGSGTNTALSIAERISAFSDLNSKEGVFIYVYIGDHLARSLGKIPSLTWLKETPQYSHDGKEYLGSLEVTNPIRTKLLIMLHKYFPMFENKIFPPFSDDDYEYVCHLVVQMKEKLIKSHPQSRFFLYKHPLDYEDVPEKFSSCLAKHSINVDSLNIQKEEKYYIPIDGHPTKLANDLIAKSLAKIVGCAQKNP